MHYLKQQIDSYSEENFVEEYEDYNPAYTYQVSSADPLPDGDGGAIVKSGNYYYRTIINDNIGNDPEDEYSTKWVRYGVSNSFAMLDLSAGSKSYFQPHYTTTGLTQTVTTVIGEVVYVDVVGSATVTADRYYYKALTVQTGIDLNVEDFTNGTNWEIPSVTIATDPVTEIYGNYMSVTFDKGDIDTLVIGNYAARYIQIEMLDAGGAVVDTQVREHSVNDDVTDYYSYIYTPYSLTTGLDLAVKLLPIGEAIRVTFATSIKGAEVSCGFLIGGSAYDMGDTKIGVNFSFNSYSVRSTDDFGILTIKKRGIQQLVDFDTYVESKTIAQRITVIKSIYDDVMAFIIDPIENSLYDSLITLGVVENVSSTLVNPVQSVISWSIQETI